MALGQIHNGSWRPGYLHLAAARGPLDLAVAAQKEVNRAGEGSGSGNHNVE